MIRWWKLIGAKEKKFLEKAREMVVSNVEGNINDVWNRIATF